MNIVNVGYDSTNYYILADTKPRLLVDAGWPGTMPKFQHVCKRAGIAIPDIKHIFVTHFHPDHAGLAHSGSRESGRRESCSFKVLFRGSQSHPNDVGAGGPNQFVLLPQFDCCHLAKWWAVRT